LISGRGSNLSSLARAAGDPAYPAEISLVVSNRPEAPGLDIARKAGIESAVVDHRSHGTREAFEAELQHVLDARGIELIACAGFMRVLTEGFVGSWHNRMINIHPSLLPSYRGLHTHERALADGVCIHGCTVHFVRADVDTGPIIAQAAVPVLPGDTAESLAARVLAQEHILFPWSLRMVASGAVTADGDRIVRHVSLDGSASLIVPPLQKNTSVM
jgi:phosphoribosylglycinamide formyltransferase-1